VSFSNDQNASIIAQASVGIARVDLHGHFTLVNPAYCALLGRTEAELLSMRMQDVTHPDDLPGNLEMIAECVASGHPFTVEKRYLRPDGTPIWVENSVALLRDEHGAPSHVLAVSHDIGGRKATETLLVGAEERYRLVGRATNDVIWDWDRSTGLVVWSESMRTVFGYDPAEATGPIDDALAWWSSHIHETQREDVVSTFLAASQGSGETWAKEYLFRAADGTDRPVMDRGYIARDATGAPTRMVGSMQDISHLRRAAMERERLVAQLAAERQKLETILTELPVGVVVADASGRLIFGNPQVETIWRHPLIPSASVDQYAAWKGFHPDGAPIQPHEWPLAKALLTGETVRQQTLHFERGDGSGRGVLQVSATPLVDSSGAAEGAVVVFSDVTERERLYETARTAQFDAESANRMKDDFLAVLSHELRTPLNAILGWTHMLTGDQLSPERTAHALKVIERNTRAQAQMVEDLLDVSAIIRGKLRLHRASIDLAAVVQAGVESVRPMAEERQVTLTLTRDEAAIDIQGDPARLQQVVWNLVSNAVKFTPEGGAVDVKLESAPGDSVRIIVRDSGHGIDSAFLPFVFERFRQDDATTTREHGGLGLGLAIVRHLVDAHGGTVEAESGGPGTGSTFTVTLPRAT
jgi:PAS domain S-box-containing protein